MLSLAQAPNHHRLPRRCWRRRHSKSQGDSERCHPTSETRYYGVYYTLCDSQHPAALLWRIETAARPACPTAPQTLSAAETQSQTALPHFFRYYGVYYTLCYS